jgi:hypothetical protein
MGQSSLGPAPMRQTASKLPRALTQLVRFSWCAWCDSSSISPRYKCQYRNEDRGEHQRPRENLHERDFRVHISTDPCLPVGCDRRDLRSEMQYCEEHCRQNDGPQYCPRDGPAVVHRNDPRSANRFGIIARDRAPMYLAVRKPFRKRRRARCYREEKLKASASVLPARCWKLSTEIFSLLSSP